MKTNKKNVVKPPRAENAKEIKIPWMMLALGFIFLINPNMHIFDVLPDIFGYAIICSALTKLSLLSSTLAEAKKAFEKMIMVDAGKIAALLWVFLVDTSSSRASSFMLFSFVLGVLEIIFLIPAFLKLFKGISDLGDYHPNIWVHKTVGKSKLSLTERVRNFCMFFAVLKPFMTVLPELSELTAQSYDESNIFNNVSRYIGVMRMFASIPVIVVGIILLVKVFGYFSKLKSDKELNAALREKYVSDVLPKKGIFAVKNVKMGAWFITAAAFLTFNITLEEIDFNSGLFVAAALVISVVYLAKSVELNIKKLYIILAGYAAVSVAAYVFKVYFEEKYRYSAMDTDTKTFVMYIVLLGLAIAEAVMLICAFKAVFTEMKKIISEHTGYVLGKELNTELEQGAIAELHTELEQGFGKAFVIAVLYGITDILRSATVFFEMFFRKSFGVLGLINFAFGFLFVLALVHALDDLRYSVETKYMLEA